MVNQQPNRKTVTSRSGTKDGSWKLAAARLFALGLPLEDVPPPTGLPSRNFKESG